MSHPVKASRFFGKIAESWALKGKSQANKRAIASHKRKRDEIYKLDGMGHAWGSIAEWGPKYQSSERPWEKHSFVASKYVLLWRIRCDTLLCRLLRSCSCPSRDGRMNTALNQHQSCVWPQNQELLTMDTLKKSGNILNSLSNIVYPKDMKFQLSKLSKDLHSQSHIKRTQTPVIRP